MNEAIKALEGALVKARGEVLKLESALSQLRPAIFQQANPNAAQALVGGMVGIQQQYQNT